MLFDLLGRKRGKVLKLCALIEYLIKNILWKNHAENMHQKLVPDSVLVLVNNPKQSLDARNSFKSKKF